ncbi:tRNA glutamyl-Q(34) synthetase GluQRS [Roseateles sp. BYS180W]|uniref:Glutamyl-Q tRNA(Asp) synthetase n=1 Tax=Roseateles rivi TaxID=3299028 RepID=A0ABW7FV68_9BURK
MSAVGHALGQQPYVGRFAPSPTGVLHAGSLVAALASWLDARAHGGRWLVRIEDVDGPRCVAGADQHILWQLAQLELVPDEAPLWQSRRGAVYEEALRRLVASGWAYPCACSRSDIALAHERRGLIKPRHGELVYPGTCRTGLQGRPGRAWRLYVGTEALGVSSLGEAPSSPHILTWQDRRLGAQQQDVPSAVGDFVLKRSDGLWAYQLAVVVDDAAQGVTDVVRGEDLADNTPRQCHLQERLALPRPRYLHTPLVLAADGHKLSKQNGAAALNLGTPELALQALREAAAYLELGEVSRAQAPGPWLQDAVAAWARRWC